MKAQMLKLAGVKTEKEFYKKYPTEKAFMAKHGKELKKAQDGNKFLPSVESTLDYDYMTPYFEYGEISDVMQNSYNNKMALARQLGVMQDFPDVNPNAALKGTSSTTATKSSNVKDAGNSLLASAPSIVGGIQNVIKGNKQLKQQKQAVAISELVSQAAGTRDDKKTRKYVRPEDIILQPGQMGNPYGFGTNYLAAKNGAEIQNTFAPNTIYTDQGYTPLNDNSKVKQFANGGGFGGTGLTTNYLASEAGGLGGGLGSLIGGGDFEQTNEGALGSTLGGIAGTIVGGPLGSIVGSALGGAIGGAFGGDRTKQMKQQQQLMQSNLASAAFQNTLQSGQFNSFMKDGGWVSNDWTPQVIAKFGEYDVKDLLKPPHDADMLRAGGHLKEYTPPSARAMYTGKAEDGVQMAMGGDLKVYRGEAETMSYNPYLPDGGETIMFRGPSHDDGGMPITFGENGVEVEGGEPAVKLQDGGSPDGNLVVFGDMFMPGKKQKFKHYAADLSKTEAKQNKIVDKSTKLINDLDVNTEFDKLSLQAANANILGANMKLKDIATKKTEAAALQNAILDTAEEQGLVSAELAKGKIVKDKEAMKKAKFGAKMETAKEGKNTLSSAKFLPSSITVPNFAASNDAVDMRAAFMPEAYAPIDMRNDVKNIPHTPYDGTFVQKRDVTPAYNEDTSMSTSTTSTENTQGKGFNFGDAALFASSMMRFLRPSNQEPLDPNQLMGEMFALSQNQLEPVQAQLYTPQLTQPYEISLQDQLNANQSDFNAMQRQLGNNPEALAALAAQKYAANSQVLGTQFRANQAEKARAYEANRQTLNEAQRANLGILDQQFQRQSTARSKTKQEALTALQSIAAKMAQQNLANRTLGVYENMYNYRYAPGGQAYSMNAPYSFNIPTVGSGAASTSEIALTEAERLQALADAQKIKEANSKSKKGRNGAIVKAIKGL
jgi:hypothetical protein